jgi:hypothetical protein
MCSQTLIDENIGEIEDSREVYSVALECALRLESEQRGLECVWHEQTSCLSTSVSSPLSSPLPLALVGVTCSRVRPQDYKGRIRVEEQSVGQVLKPEACKFLGRQSSPAVVPKMSSRVRTRSPVS